MRTTSVVAVLLSIANVAYASSSIYGSAFDYMKAAPASVYFSGKDREQIESYCQKEILGTIDLGACAQFRYELVRAALNKRILEVEKILEVDDKENGLNDEPSALPFFKKSQVNWELYRDNNCYSDAYSVGQASLRFVDFWDCMARITRRRLDDLTQADADE